MKKIFTYTIIFITLFNAGAIAQSRDEAQVAAAVESLRKAMVDGDKAGLDKLTAEGLSYGHSSGLVQNKQEYIDAIVSGKNDFSSIELTDQTIKLSGPAAVVRHVFTASLTDNGKPATAKIAVLQVWQKDHKQWKLLARQAVKI